MVDDDRTAGGVAGDISSHLPPLRRRPRREHPRCPVGDGAERNRRTHGSYRFPLREDVAVTLRLPTDLTAAQAARLTAFVTALPIQPDDASEAVHS